MNSTKKTVKKSNSLARATYTLSTIEQRLLFLAIANSKGCAENLKRVSIYATEYAMQYETTPEAAYMALKEASDTLFERRFTYTDVTELGNPIEKRRRWVQGVDYIKNEGRIAIIFSDDVLPALIEQAQRFTYFQLDSIKGLTSMYALRLYELLISWRGTQKTNLIKLEVLRQQLGVLDDKYKRLAHFKERVLHTAITQINTHTDITVQYEQHKRGRSITGFSFTFKQKSPRPEPKGRRPITKAQAQKEARRGEGWKELYKRLSADFIIED